MAQRRWEDAVLARLDRQWHRLRRHRVFKHAQLFPSYVQGTGYHVYEKTGFTPARKYYECLTCRKDWY